ncbi:MAG: PT domain-containing protein, partial [Candidatus Ornithomonoglobus sp.]
MKRTFNKALSLLSSAAIAASMITVPVTAGAEGASASYTDGALTVTTDKAYASADVYVASYNADGTLRSVTKTPVSLAEGDNTISDVIANAGDKILIWDDQEPIVSALEVRTAEETDVPTEQVTDVPTSAPTGAPTESATDAPTEQVTTAPTEAVTDAPGDVTVIKSWKFDMGTAEDTAEGWTAVTSDINYTLNTSGEDQYGFIGTNAKDYTLAGGRIDGFVQQDGQIIELTAGGGTGLYDGIGSTGADISGNAGDKYYPVRFALKVLDDTYYRIKATVTTLDSSKDATASLYTERKHPLYTNKTIRAGETVTTEFTIRPTAIYYQKSDPTGEIADGMVNVAVLGENTALAALEIDQIETAPVLWVLGDSTVTDGGATLPFSPYPNYTGVGTGLTKYLPHNIAMVNEG